MTDRERFDKAWETYAACNTIREPKHIAWWFFERGLEQGDHKMGEEWAGVETTIKERDARIAELEAKLADTIVTIANLKEEIKDPTYCTTCGNCGEEGCCGIHKCQYPQDTPETIERIAELEDQLAATKEQQ